MAFHSYEIYSQDTIASHFHDFCPASSSFNLVFQTDMATWFEKWKKASSVPCSSSTDLLVDCCSRDHLVIKEVCSRLISSIVIAFTRRAGFAFIYMEDERDAEDAIRGLDRRDFGRQGRRLRVEWTNQERGGRSGGSKKSSTNSRPSKTLFVINFDPVNTRTRDLERHFEPYGKILNVRIRRNFAFIQFELQEDATTALEATNMRLSILLWFYGAENSNGLHKLIDRIITVEYSARDDDADNRNGHSPNRRGRGSPDRRGRDRDRGERGIERGSPDYGRGPSPYSKPDSGSNSRSNGAEVESPDYDRYRSRSPSRQE